MERKNITIREELTDWVEAAGVNLSPLVQESIDERMGPTEEDIAVSYRESADRATGTDESRTAVSREGNDHLGPVLDEE